MTTCCDAAWSDLAFMMWEGYWRRAFGARVPPQVGVIDHRVRGLEVVYDPLIRVPDFFAATLSRWDADPDVILRPEGAKDKAMARYFAIMMNWLPENATVWLARLWFLKEDVRAGRVVSARTLRRLKRRYRLDGVDLGGAHGPG